MKSVGVTLRCLVEAMERDWVREGHSAEILHVLCNWDPCFRSQFCAARESVSARVCVCVVPLACLCQVK